jgi:hypothetical protein
MAYDMYSRVETITPHDTSGEYGYKGFIVNTGGTAYIDPMHNGNGGTNCKINLTAGIVYPIGISRIRATGTSAEGFLGLK